MRGKLRDKRTDTKRDSFKRDVMERRRPTKRDNRISTWLYQQVDQEDELLLEEEEVAVKQTNTK